MFQNKINGKFVLWRAAGGLFGYLLADWGGGGGVAAAGRVGSIIFQIGGYYFHLHHWLIAIALFLLGIFNILPFFKKTIPQGMIIGIIFHGVFDYSDWYEVIKKISL